MLSGLASESRSSPTSTILELEVSLAIATLNKLCFFESSSLTAWDKTMCDCISGPSGWFHHYLLQKHKKVKKSCTAAPQYTKFFSAMYFRPPIGTGLTGTF
jgi:hypothetical protein